VLWQAAGVESRGFRPSGDTHCRMVLEGSCGWVGIGVLIGDLRRLRSGGMWCRSFAAVDRAGLSCEGDWGRGGAQPPVNSGIMGSLAYFFHGGYTSVSPTTVFRLAIELVSLGDVCGRQFNELSDQPRVPSNSRRSALFKGNMRKTDWLAETQCGRFGHCGALSDPSRPTGI
jgi:hypothetical protein